MEPELDALQDEVAVCHVREVGDDLVRQLNALIAQLSSTAAPLTSASLRRVVDSECSLLFVARRSDRIVGTACLAILQTPTGVRAFIEDVVVDSGSRREGIGELLTRAAITSARQMGARTVDLTCRPERSAAARLYRKLGFRARHTNYYRLECA